jgi:hypothetical protein
MDRVLVKPGHSPSGGCECFLNYNACDFSSGLPVTLKFADRVGEILTAPLADFRRHRFPFDSTFRIVIELGYVMESDFLSKGARRHVQGLCTIRGPRRMVTKG